jgi:hypothetical protein
MINIFLSWSSPTGKLIAMKLRSLLKTQLRRAKPFMSDVDIEKGQQWKKILDDSLMENRYGMFIVTPDVNSSVWMGYEAGAIYTTRKNREINILPLLFEGQGDRVPNYLSEQKACGKESHLEDCFAHQAAALGTLFK